MENKIKEVMTDKIPHECLVKLQAIYGSLKTAEKKAADLLLERPDFFATTTIVEAADAAGCSEATIVRLARKLGYKGYPELKSVLLEVRENKSVKLYEEINENDDEHTIVKKVFSASIQALEDTLNVLDKNQYTSAVQALMRANKILVCGVGDAASVAKSGYHKFMRIGLNVQAPEDLDLQLISSSHMSESDVVIAISHSGRTKSILDIAKHAKNSAAKIISITNYPLSPLAKHSDIVLLTATFAEHVKGEVMSKRVAELCILESLYVNLLLKSQNNLKDNLSKSNIALEINKI